MQSRREVDVVAPAAAVGVDSVPVGLLHGEGDALEDKGEETKFSLSFKD